MHIPIHLLVLCRQALGLSDHLPADWLLAPFTEIPPTPSKRIPPNTLLPDQASTAHAAPQPRRCTCCSQVFLAHASPSSQLPPPIGDARASCGPQQTACQQTGPLHRPYRYRQHTQQVHATNIPEQHNTCSFLTLLIWLLLTHLAVACIPPSQLHPPTGDAPESCGTHQTACQQTGHSPAMQMATRPCRRPISLKTSRRTLGPLATT